MNLILDIRIRDKLLISSTILSIIFCIAVAVYHLTLTMVISDYEHLTSHDLLVAYKAQTIQLHILKIRKAEVEFLRDGDEKFPSRVRDNLQSIQDLTVSIRQLVSTEPMFALVALDAELIRKRIGDYRAVFEHIVEAYNAKGTDENSGFYGRFRTIIRDTEEFCLTHKTQVPQGMELLSEIRRYEKDYLVRGRYTYQEKIHAAVAHLLMTFRSSGLPSEVVITLEEQLTAYQLHFDQIVAKDKTIAIRSFALIEAAEEIERIADTIIASVEKVTNLQLHEIKTKSKRYVALALSFCLIAILVGLGLMHFFNNSITRPLAAVVEKIQEISAGNYNVVVPVSSRDETGQLATAFNEMVVARRLANEALYRANLVIESSPVVLFRWKATQSWPVEMVSDNVSQFGYTPDELLSGKTPYSAIVHPEDLERVIREVQQYSESGVSPIRQEYRIVSPAGDVYWTDDRTTIERDADGNITHYQGIVIDITERKEVESAIRKSDEQWNRTFNSFTDIVTLQDVNLQIVKTNRAACTTLDLACDEVIGQHCYQLFADADTPCPECPLLDTRKTFQAYSREMYHEKLKKTFLVSASPVFDEQGKLEYIAHVAKDISDLKKLQKELFHAQKMEAIGTLAGGIAHDFNNILAAIIGYSELIKNEVPVGSCVGKDILEVIGASNRAAELVKQILTFSRQKDSKKQPLRPHLIVKEALKMLRSTLPTTITIQQYIDPDCGLILADPTNIHQITVNLCTNALHAMTDGKGTLNVELHHQELTAAALGGGIVTPGPFVVLTVSDSGCGMNKATIDRIFDPYFTTKEIGKGTGLGLAVIQGIVQDVHGFIRVTSIPGEGSSFIIYFPEFQEKMYTEGSEEIVIPQRGDEHILVVDDEPFLVRVTQRQLENHGYTVTGISSSKDALEMIEANPWQFDLLITDQTMPRLTGMELALAVMAIRPDLPVILCTGHSDLVSEEEALQSGVKRYITKPIAANELTLAARSVLDGN